MAELSPDRWKEVSPYLDQALSLPNGERAAFVASFRDKNSSLADLLQTLLKEHSFIATEQFLGKGPIDEFAIVGQRLGPYHIEELLGSGGMGEVYRAVDTRLNRTVAIKVLPAHFSSDPVRRLRFEREAKAISALQSRNICVLYDIGREDEVDYLVMEYLEGETLGQWMERMRKQDAAACMSQLLDFSIQTAPGAGGGTSERHRAPRHQASQYLHYYRRRGEDSGFRHRHVSACRADCLGALCRPN